MRTCRNYDRSVIPHLGKAAGALLAVGAVSASGAFADKPTAKSASVASASASAYARDNGDGGTPSGYVSSSGNGGQGSGRASVSPSTQHGDARATASAGVGNVSIFNGLVKADAASAAAAASGDGSERTTGRVSRLVIAGERQRTPQS